MQRPQTRKDLVSFILILGGIIGIGPLTIDIYLPAFNAIGAEFEASERMVQLSLTSYFIGIALGQISYGPIVDRFGKKPPLFFGLALFMASSIGCYFSVTIEQMICFRFFQAIGACAATVIPRAIVRDIFSPQESARVYSHLVLVTGVGPMMAPLIGNILLECCGWRSIFSFLAALSLCGLILVYFAIPETKGANKEEKISKAFRKYWGILHDRSFLVNGLCGGMMMAGLFSYITGSPAIYLDHFAISERQYGLIFSLNSLGFVVFSQINARLLKKFRSEFLLRKIMLMPLVVGVLMMLVSDDFWLVTALFSAFVCCCGMIFPNTSALSLANHAVHSGSAAALLGTIQFSLAALGSFMIGKLSANSPMKALLIVGIAGIVAFVINYFDKPVRNSARSHN
jgi:DHA1 family bicyclomycin/chloramphenicol resistance-like MFS transporter